MVIRELGIGRNSFPLVDRPAPKSLLRAKENSNRGKEQSERELTTKNNNYISSFIVIIERYENDYQ